MAELAVHVDSLVLGSQICCFFSVMFLWEREEIRYLLLTGD